MPIFVFIGGTVTTLIPGATGTVLSGANMTGGGGLAAAYDGNNSKARAACSIKDPSVSGYGNTNGKDWGVGVTKTITRFRVVQNNSAGAGFLDSASTTLKLQGSTDSFASSTVDLYTSGSIAASSGAITDVTSGITVSTAYRYHRIAISGDGANGCTIAAIEFYEDI